MKKLIKKGRYTLFETKNHTKILSLGDSKFAWVSIPDIGSILVKTKLTYQIDTLLSGGEYKLYKVKNEPKLVDLQHLELEAAPGQWQGYLLPKGLPTFKQKRHRIISTDETITKK